MKATSHFLSTIASGIVDIVKAINNIADIIGELKVSSVTMVDFHRVVWLDATGNYVLIWYADGTGSILHNEGFVMTLSAANKPGKVTYTLNNGKVMEFDDSKVHCVVD
jgi:penicillin V acylase-like amidase (Ntn superfamily)